MNTNAFDDQYEGCELEMEYVIREHLLEQEKDIDPDFAHAWDLAMEAWAETKDYVSGDISEGFLDEFGAAIIVYSNDTVYSGFNEAVRNYDRENFNYHSLHFFMTQAMNHLRTDCPAPVYRGVNRVRLLPEDVGGEIRFGQFTSSSRNQTVAENFGTGTFFNISTCFGADIHILSAYPGEEEVLIPVDEVFEVTDFTRDEGESRFVLTTTKSRCHYYNCDYLGKGGKSRTCVFSRVPTREPKTPFRTFQSIFRGSKERDNFSTKVLSYTHTGFTTAYPTSLSS
ncbi:PREDICTED: ecto-ADP-ribosyltransferase 5-like [Nanorana parkeri]|uniref:ecto-ADP-ribosyltransferase 5-like n=1 Tax=Nanorana parkeri TaxID=125878 RepID=UPI0008550444|nr:PREDICTED: ecto-ADP-ribosyltransferase 5-like [Nanorana parkeri]